MAITTSVADVLAIAPELEARESSIPTFIENAKLEIAEDIYLAKANYAVALLAAHELTLFMRQSEDGTAESIRRKRLGDAEVEFGTVSGSTTNADDLTLTAYGKTLLRLKKQLVTTPLVLGC